MIFKCFSGNDREIDWLNSKVNEYIEEHERKGYSVVKQDTLTPITAKIMLDSFK
jgi:hypothetical protein